MKFSLHCQKIDDGPQSEFRTLFYDNQTGLLMDETGKPFGQGRNLQQRLPAPFRTDGDAAPIRKSNAPRVLKVQMGLSCNYECSYCLQRFVPRADESSLKLIPGFIEKVKANLVGQPQSIQLWGGEPLVYIKTLRPLVAALKEIYPDSEYSIITNGALLSDPIIDWLMENRIGVSMSHDGPGQSFRGPDPFDDVIAGPAIKKLYKLKKEAGQPMTINPMIHAQNMDRAAVAAWIVEKIGDPEVILGEGAVIEVYDEATKENSLRTHEDRIAIRQLAFRNTRWGADHNFAVVHERMNEWRTTMTEGRSLDSLGMKCGMDQHDTLTVDLNGNVLTCQNVSTVSTAPNGKPHMGGNIANIAGVKIETSVHFANRDHCAGCPVVQACKGGCMYLVGDLFYASCNNTYSDHISFFANAVESLTGWTPVYIEDEAGKLPEERRDVFGYGKPVPVLS